MPVPNFSQFGEVNLENFSFCDQICPTNTLRLSIKTNGTSE